MIEPRSTDLQPWPLAMAAFRRVWAQRDDLLRLAVVPFVPAFALYLWIQDVLADVVRVMPPGQQPNPEVMVALQGPFLLYGLGSLCILGIFSVNWMRFLMLGNSAGGGLGIALGRRHFRLVLLAIGLQFLASLILSIVMTIGALILGSNAIVFAIFILGIIWYLIAAARLTPVWVGIAIDAPMKLGEAWRRTHGYGIKLAVAVVIVSFLLLALQSAFFWLSLGLGVSELAPLALSFISVAIQFIMFAAIGAVLVLAYPRFVSETV